MIDFANKQYKEDDLKAWEKYRRLPTRANRAEMLKRLEPIIQRQVGKWAGPVSRDVLTQEARILAAKALDTYDPDRGTALATHITNNLAPLSRIVYTHQNAARLPENVAIKVHSYNAAKEHLTHMQGREPTTDELHQELGWGTKELKRMEDYQRKDLVESVGGLSGDFYDDDEDSQEDMLAAVYFSLSPEEKKLLEATTGYNNSRKLGTQEILKKFGWTQAQLSYKKTLLTRKISELMGRK